MSTQRYTHKALHHLGATALLAAVGSVTLAPIAAADTAGNGATSATEYVWEVDMRGKPPYRRERVEVPVVEVAAIEIEQAYDGETVTVWERETSGRPPFKRQRIEVPVMDAASVELADEQEQKTIFRGRPPFKRHR